MITPRQFLIRVQYKGNNKSLKEFDDEHNDDPEVKATLDALHLDRSTDDEGDEDDEGATGGADVPLLPSKVCVVCMVVDYSVIFSTCRHLCICTACLDQIKKIARDQALIDLGYSAADIDKIDDGDNELLDVLATIEYTLQCPLCKTEHKPNEVGPVFTP